MTFDIKILSAAFLATTIAATTAFADPPPWAPAHGWREKHEGHHEGHAYYQPMVAMPWRSASPAPFGIDSGTCRRDLLGAVLGGGAGAVLGSTIGKGQGKLVAVAGGAILGMLAGGAVGRSMDEVDQNCVGQALEHAPNGQRVAWSSPDGGQAYTVVPTQTFEAPDGRYCREYTTKARIGGRIQQTYGRACRQPDGPWQIVN